MEIHFLEKHDDIDVPSDLYSEEKRKHVSTL